MAALGDRPVKEERQAWMKAPQQGESSSSGRRPRRSDAAPVSGDDRNCSREKSDPIRPEQTNRSGTQSRTWTVNRPFEKDEKDKSNIIQSCSAGCKQEERQEKDR
jgi:hypothetical protein